jgi:hypothetical protein
MRCVPRCATHTQSTQQAGVTFCGSEAPRACRNARDATASLELDGPPLPVARQGVTQRGSSQEVRQTKVFAAQRWRTTQTHRRSRCRRRTRRRRATRPWRSRAWVLPRRFSSIRTRSTTTCKVPPAGRRCTHPARLLRGKSRRHRACCAPAIAQSAAKRWPRSARALTSSYLRSAVAAGSAGLLRSQVARDATDPGPRPRRRRELRLFVARVRACASSPSARRGAAASCGACAWRGSHRGGGGAVGVILTLVAGLRAGAFSGDSEANKLFVRGLNYSTTDSTCHDDATSLLWASAVR